MDEKLHQTPEKHEQLVWQPETHEHKTPSHEKSGEVSHERKPDSIDAIRESIEREAQSSEKVIKQKKEEEEEQPKKISYFEVGLELKNHSFNHTLKKVQRKLPAPQRAFSKLIHNPDVEIFSEVTGQTIARPSGLLFGGFFSAVGSIAVLLLSRHFGYEYNFIFAIICFIGGFFIGLILELLYRILRKSPV